MIITSSGLLAIVFGITAALILFIITGIWACFEVIEHFTEKDDKFEYLVETQECTKDETIPELLNNRGKSGWELVTMYGDRFIFIRPLKNK